MASNHSRPHHGIAERLEKSVIDACVFAGEHNEDKKARAGAALWKLYSILDKAPPAIVWCESLYQLTTLPSLLIGLLHSDLWQVISGTLDQLNVKESWDSDFEEAWEGLWMHGGYQLLKGMSVTSRLGRQYGDLETALIEQCKNEFSACLRSGKLQLFEQSLNKERIYRQFWAPYLYQINEVNDRIRHLNADIDVAFSQEIELQKSIWVHFQPHDQRIRTNFSGSLNSVMSLIALMGAEPASQLSRAVWCPISSPSLVLAAIWQNESPQSGLRHYSEEMAVWGQLSDSVFGFIALDHLAFVCPKPQVFTIDEGGRLHNAEGPALKFADGFAAYFWHGVNVEQRIIYEPNRISIDEIEHTRNLELRRVLIERYGLSRYLEDSGTEAIHQDESGILYRKNVPGDEPIVMVKVINSTAEPDGTFREYFLRVPPHMETARQAVAWTFGIEEEEYIPLAET